MGKNSYPRDRNKTRKGFLKKKDSNEMTIIETAKITSKGQVTIPHRVRKLLRLEKGSAVAFEITKEGVLLMPCKVTTQSPNSPKEWEKIAKLASESGTGSSGRSTVK